MKTTAACGLVLTSSVFTYLFGPFDYELQTLCIFMVADIIMGLLAAIKGKSKKTETGYLSSKACYDGLIKKFSTLLIVVIAVRLDVMMQTQIVRGTVILSFTANELLSILETYSKISGKVPKILSKILDILLKEEYNKPVT